MQPDIVLVEGPPDADKAIHWLAHPDMEPPIALIIYRPDMPKQATYYPFAIFSPELQAIRYAQDAQIPARFMDLPQTHFLAMETKISAPDLDPMQQLAEIAGYPNHEAWWNQIIEQRQDTSGVFDGVLTMMTAIRETVKQPVLDDATEAGLRFAEQREAYMRQCIRQAQAEGFQRIAIVCGAWHAPALRDTSDESADTIILKDLPETEIDMAWVPWTYSRMSNFAGYGAGVRSPGWYHHLWDMGQQNAPPTDISIRWLTQVVNLLRKDGQDASSAHIIEAVRLAESLAAMRDLSLPGLVELNEATQSVICFGDPTPLQLIQTRLIISERMGTVPPDSPMVPLQRDLAAQQKRLRLRPQPEKSTLNLDLRNERHLARSHLLHRLQLLQIPWGRPVSVRNKQGTYREVWHLRWLPDFAVRVIEANIWGNTVQDAAAAYAQDTAENAKDLATLTDLLDRIILADLPDTIAFLMQRIEAQAALSSDIPHLMDALLPLANVLRYGSVRNTDKGIVQNVVDGLLKRICIGFAEYVVVRG